MTTENIQKILFLGVMLAVTLFGGKAHIATSAPEENGATSAPRFSGETPFFSLAAQESRGDFSGQDPGDVRSAGSVLLAPTIHLERIPDPSKSTSSVIAPPAFEKSASVKPEGGRISSAGRADGQASLRGEEAGVYRAFRGHPEVFPGTDASAALLADLETGEAYFAVRETRRWPIASITKLMTAVISLERLPPHEEITIVSSDLVVPTESTSTRRLEIGGVYTVRDLISLMLVFSNNESAEALARSIGRAEFVRLMNEKAASWGLAETHFKDPTGLSASNQSTSADLQTLTLRITKEYEEIMKITKKPQAVVTERMSGKIKTFPNINLLASRPDVLGGKTGFTEEAGGNLLTLFMHGGRTVFAIILGSDDRFGETEKLIAWFKSSFSRE